MKYLKNLALVFLALLIFILIATPAKADTSVGYLGSTGIEIEVACPCLEWYFDFYGGVQGNGTSGIVSQLTGALTCSNLPVGAHMSLPKAPSSVQEWIFGNGSTCASGAGIPNRVDVTSNFSGPSTPAPILAVATPTPNSTVSGSSESSASSYNPANGKPNCADPYDSDPAQLTAGGVDIGCQSDWLSYHNYLDRQTKPTLTPTPTPIRTVRPRPTLTPTPSLTPTSTPQVLMAQTKFEGQKSNNLNSSVVQNFFNFVGSIAKNFYFYVNLFKSVLFKERG